MQGDKGGCGSVGEVGFVGAEVISVTIDMSNL